ncbi:GAF domain-containing protein [Pararhodobacter zhoushanensis]|uniref:GAF domain-containing protein n=1 Tax=Pararhodobacter zhoushanensis TaxID=2479545 RepID=A0ABT3H3H4_9RHOB|nr:GAF domain-containing protein [Pararhodobacter zhoushanensis]MCW1934243.1 GAF domain-containing protein [Pararhodobacter zhoushanensis]
MTPTATFTAALEQAATRTEAFEALGRLVADTLGIKLVTVMTMDFTAGVARRAYTSHPVEYPVSGDKPIRRDAWFDQVHGRGQPFVANTIEDIANVFPDADTIASLGCASVVNIPVRVQGQIIGTLNMLDVAGYFDPATVARCEELLRLPATACFLLPA